MEQDLEWLEYEVGRLKDKCDELEKENFELRRCIGRAITILNETMKEPETTLRKTKRKS